MNTDKTQMNIDADQKKWTSGSHFEIFNFHGGALYLSVFICVYLW